jgi:hypothetical protein
MWNDPDKFLTAHNFLFAASECGVNELPPSMILSNILSTAPFSFLIHMPHFEIHEYHAIHPHGRKFSRTLHLSD